MTRMDKLHRLVATVRSQHAKRSSRRPAPAEDTHSATLPYLPPELWILILRYATSSCATFDCSPSTVCFLNLAHSHNLLQHRLAHYRSVMRRRALMTLICKEWRVYGQEVLYEYVWISRASEARALAAVLSGSDNGKYIRRLHIETPSLERCCPIFLRAILDRAPRLVVYSDYRSIRRNRQIEKNNPQASPQQLLSALAHPNNSLRRLSWTNYDDVSFHLHMSPMLETTAANLEFLELTFCSTHLHNMSSMSTMNFSSPTSSTSISTSPSTPSALSSTCTDTPQITLTLPSLRSLKVTLDNATFAVLATWEMPVLQNLSVLSADFSYASSGFSEFFVVHGPKLTQLELGHSSSTIEEHYLTSHHVNLFPGGGPGGAAGAVTGPGATGTSSSRGRIPLAAWCPNLIEFICSADAEWNWQHPDWIAPHVLLPSHPTLQLIGIRDIDKRLRDDAHAHPTEFFVLQQQIGSLLRRDAFPALLYIRDMSWESDLMRRGVGVGLMTCASASAVGLVHERSGASPSVGGSSMLGGMLSALPSIPSFAGRRRRMRGFSEAEAAARRDCGETAAVLRFWECVLERCREGGVWLEDFRGVNVTMRDLRRVQAEKNQRGPQLNAGWGVGMMSGAPVGPGGAPGMSAVLDAVTW